MIPFEGRTGSSCESPAWSASSLVLRLKPSDEEKQSKALKGNNWCSRNHMLFWFNCAKDEISEVDNEEAWDALSIIELLKENLELWKEKEDDEDNPIDDL